MKMIQGRGAVALTAMFLAVSVLAGCEDECKTGKTDCINSELIRTCVPTADDPEWLITECPEHSVCVDDGAGAEADAGASAAGGAACVGKCDLGEQECVSDALARVCIEGGIWQLDACGVGEKCTDGVCQVGGGVGSVQACVPDTKQCASDMVEKICDPDGTAWIQQPCAFNEHCVGTECVPDTTASCDDGNVCLDAKTAVRCLGQDEGFELVPCEGDTYCEFGRCRGPACVIGSVCSGPVNGLTGVASQVRTCADGLGFEDTQCNVNEVCKQDKDWASCVPNVCVPGVTQCGDPRDPTVDPTKFFTTCAGATATSSLVPEWVQGECAGELICDPTMVFAGTPCRRTCTPGAQQCAADSALGTSSGIQTCGPDGTWLAAETCHIGTDLLKTCHISPNPDASALPVAVCGEPVCARVFSGAGVAAGFEGTCDTDGKLQRCNPDGTLGDPEDCLQGVCANGAFEVVQGDGRIAGACQVTPQCQEGDERCVWVGLTPTPQFQGCVNGFWSTHLQNCPSDGLCYPTKTAENRPGKLCGAECSPGGHTCIPDPNNVGQTLLATCGATGQYDDGAACPAGACTGLTNNDAACVMQCLPGKSVCSGFTVAAADGVHTGTDSSSTCSADGTLEVATACAAGTACRTSSTGVVLGCVECIGPTVAGGNTEGVNDSTCDPAAAATILECDGNNELTPRTCDGTKVCAGATPATCGTCSDGTGIGANFVSCTQTALVAAQVCGACTIDTDAGAGAATATLTSCTESAIVAAVGVMGGAVTCAGQGQGTPIAWDGVADCCSLVADGFAGCVAGGYGVPTAVSGAADCCSAGVIPGGGGTFAYCAEP